MGSSVKSRPRLALVRPKGSDLEPREAQIHAGGRVRLFGTIELLDGKDFEEVGTLSTDLIFCKWCSHSSHFINGRCAFCHRR